MSRNQETSEAQIEANRLNSAKSTGPVTEAGKQISSRNSQRHGLLSSRAVLQGESHQEFLGLLTSFYEEHKPQTPTEENLVENMAVARWRQLRLWSIETAGLEERMRNPQLLEQRRQLHHQHLVRLPYPHGRNPQHRAAQSLRRPFRARIPP